MFKSTLGKTCDCGYRLFKKCGRLATGHPVGTTRDAGFSASTGHPTADVDIEMNVPTQDAGFSVSTRHLTSDVDIEMNVPSGRPVGTTQDAGFSVSTRHLTSDVHHHSKNP